MSETPIRTTAYVSRTALRANLALVRSRLGSGVAVMAVVKADAYGHGAAIVGPELEGAGADWFGVATLEEGVALRAAGVTKPVLILYGIQPAQAAAAAAHDLSVAVVDAAILAPLLAASPAGMRLHVEVDSGMTRLGVRPSEVCEVFDHIRRSPKVEVEGLFSHIGNADDPYAPFADQQVRTFADVVGSVAAAGVRPPWVHLANSATTLGRSDAHWDLVRPGVCLYGVAPAAVPGLDLQPVMSLEARVWRLWEVPAGRHVGYDQTFTTQRPTRIAVLPFGYADGFPRALSSRGRVMVGGRLAPVIGRVCMDVTMVDVSEIDGVAAGDTAVVFGRREGGSPTVDEVARACDTIPYEVLVRVGARVPRTARE